MKWAAVPHSGMPSPGYTSTPAVMDRAYPANVEMPGLTPAVQACLDSTRPDVVIRSQADEAAHAGVVATPTYAWSTTTPVPICCTAGPIEGDALLSAIDLLTSAEDGFQSRREPEPPRCLPTLSATCPGSRDLQGYGAVPTALIDLFAPHPLARTSITRDGGCPSIRPACGLHCPRALPHGTGASVPTQEVPMNLSETVSDGTTCALVDYASIQEDPLIRQAIGVLEERLFRRGASLTSPTAVREYLRLKLASEALEVLPSCSSTRSIASLPIASKCSEALSTALPSIREPWSNVPSSTTVPR